MCQSWPQSRHNPPSSEDPLLQIDFRGGSKGQRQGWNFYKYVDAILQKKTDFVKIDGISQN